MSSTQDRRQGDRRRHYNRRSGVERRFKEDPVGDERRRAPDRRSGRDRRSWVERRKTPRT